MLQTSPAQTSDYALGYSENELARLIEQARFYGDLTAQILHRAELGPGMRVLDLGCGAGDVSFLAAGIVGLEGEVIGVDKSPETIALATQRARQAGLTNVQFLTQDVGDLMLDAPVDALVGRLVLMYFADPAVTLRRLVELVKPGGIVAFHEMDAEGIKSAPPCAVYETAVQRIKQTFTRVGVDIQTGLKLNRIFQEAGLPAPQMIQGARVESGPDSPIYDQVAQITRSLLPLMDRTGVATVEEVDIDTLAARMREEAVARNATLVSPVFIGAWTRKALV